MFKLQFPKQDILILLPYLIRMFRHISSEVTVEKKGNK